MEQAKMTRKEAILEIELADDPNEYERAIDFALEALKTDVPREVMVKMFSAIDHKMEFGGLSPFVKSGMAQTKLLMQRILDQYDKEMKGGNNGATD